ncbi:metal-dependent transcriptional regulator [Parasegetibacter sp. NRK P23]|uniref:metal-dependent transcriptional regulator n=1 Tax=Parasegetibacter sp. NRK P23 TaxID=2942999 RepID=UPI002042CAF4|nr:metal-dependent transcriptional regulator [Parasegetibacter sp. NRK P23]MCM5526901.1 metal-dependent transcriptional regulator [Parasegetibacter sp. NRK P23]
MNYSVSEENYIKAIYHLQQEAGNVTTNELAQELATKPASVTDMMKKLKAKKLVHYERYQGFRLTGEGSKLALLVIRRHRLWEYFLVEKLQFTWDEVHEIAEELEHVTSRKLVDRLDEYLGFPKVDPHGDPIPDKEGNVETTCQLSLLDLPLNVSAEICNVGDQSSDMLELLTHKSIQLGTKLEVKKRFGFDNSLEVKIRNLPSFTVSEQVARNLFVRT